MRSVARNLKNLVAPAGPRYRRLPFGPAAGCVMNIDFRHHASIYFGQYERQLNSSYRRMIRPGDRCFDVGAQGGYSALLMAKLSHSRVVAFECDRSAAAEILETIRRNTLAIDLVEALVGNADAPGQITLDTAARNSFVPDFIKLDIEGGEAAALDGAEEILSARKPGLIVEVHGEEQEALCIETLARHGYDVRIVEQPTSFREHRPLAHNRWLVSPGA